MTEERTIKKNGSNSSKDPPLSQGDRSLEYHTQDFLDLVHYVHYNDNSLCLFSVCPEMVFEGFLKSMWIGCFVIVDPPSLSVREEDLNRSASAPDSTHDTLPSLRCLL